MRYNRCTFSRPVRSSFVLLCMGVFLLAPNVISLAQTNKKTSAVKAPGSPVTKAGEPKFKAIWEPVNVKEDLDLTSVHFRSSDEGWVVGGRRGGKGGVILHTKNAGDTWDVQVGDPQSNDDAYHDLLFVGPSLGFAVHSGDSLLRTTDGQSWTPVGTVGLYRSDYRFTSGEVGFFADAKGLHRTRDAGRTWESAYPCQIKAEINGLTRDVSCVFHGLYFVNASVGYAMSDGIGAKAGFVMAKTEDGGATWTRWVTLPGEDGRWPILHFFDANTGVMVMSPRVFRTTDGGKTWTGVPGQIDEASYHMEFADAQVGWIVQNRNMMYTTNAGASWVSRAIAFPEFVHGFSLVQRDRGYAVGSHGMVYRYRVVPIDYNSKGMLPAPAMPAAQK